MYLLVIDNGTTEERYEYDLLYPAEENWKKDRDKRFSASVYKFDEETGKEERIRHWDKEENDKRKAAWGE